MKKDKILFWIPTVLIVLFEGVMPALTWNSPLAREGVSHLGYPGYFLPVLTVFKVLGALALIIPAVPKRIKEWAYAGFGFDFMWAFISYVIVDGINANLVLPVVCMAVLIWSYKYYHKLNP